MESRAICGGTGGTKSGTGLARIAFSMSVDILPSVKGMNEHAARGATASVMLFSPMLAKSLLSRRLLDRLRGTTGTGLRRLNICMKRTAMMMRAMVDAPAIKAIEEVAPPWEGEGDGGGADDEELYGEDEESYGEDESVVFDMSPGSNVPCGTKESISSEGMPLKVLVTRLPWNVPVMICVGEGCGELVRTGDDDDVGSWRVIVVTNGFEVIRALGTFSNLLSSEDRFTFIVSRLAAMGVEWLRVVMLKSGNGDNAIREYQVGSIENNVSRYASK